MGKIFEIKTDYFSDKGISLDLEQRTNIIYGSNGAGKTTISKFIEDDSKNSAFVFNQEFVNKNVFYSNDEGFKDVSPENKKNRSKLLVSQRCIDIDNYISNILKKIDEVKKNINLFSSNDIKTKFKYSDDKITAFVNSVDVLNMSKIFEEINDHNEIVTSVLKEKKEIISNAKDEVEIYRLYCDIVDNYQTLIDPTQFIKEFDYSKNDDFIELIRRRNNWNENVKLNSLVDGATAFQKSNINKIKDIVSNYLAEVNSNKEIKAVYYELINILKKHVEVSESEVKELEKAEHLNKINEWISTGHEIHKNINNLCYYCKNTSINNFSIIDKLLLKANESQKTQSYNALTSFFWGMQKTDHF
jgi:broad-specificity NMP kinase